MYAKIHFFGVGTDKRSARVTIEQAGKPDQVFEVEDVLISDDGGEVAHWANILGIPLEEDLN